MGLAEWGGVLSGEWAGPGGGASGMGRSLTGRMGGAMRWG